LRARFESLLPGAELPLSSEFSGQKRTRLELEMGEFEKKIKMMLQGLGVVLICPSASEKQRLKQGSARSTKRLTFPENQKRSFRKQKQQSKAKSRAMLLENKRLNCALRE
jgi:hypothetical protein